MKGRLVVKSGEPNTMQIERPPIRRRPGVPRTLASALLASYIANKRRPYYRNLPPLLETFGVMAVVPAFIIGGETAGRSNKTVGEWTGL